MLEAEQARDVQGAGQGAEGESQQSRIGGAGEEGGVGSGGARQADGSTAGREGPSEAGTSEQRQVGGDRTSEGWGSALWTDTDPQFLAMYEEPGGAECLPSIEQAIRAWLQASGSAARRGEAGAGEVEGALVQEREQAWQEEGRKSGNSGRRRGDRRFGGEHEERWQCKLHGMERACELAVVERGHAAVLVGVARRVGAAEREAQMEQEVAHAEGARRVNLNQGWSGRGGTRSVHGSGRARGEHARGRDRSGRGIRMAETGCSAAMELRKSVTRELLEEQADSGRRRSSGVGARATRGQAESNGRPSQAAVNIPTGGGGGRSDPTGEVELAVPSPTKCTRANVLVNLHSSSGSEAKTLEPPQKRNESERGTLEPPAGGVMERRQRQVTRSLQEFSNAVG